MRLSGVWPFDVFGAVDPLLALSLPPPGAEGSTRVYDAEAAAKASWDADVPPQPLSFQREASSSSETWTPRSSRRPASFAGGGAREFSGSSAALSRNSSSAFSWDSGLSSALSRETSSASLSAALGAMVDDADLANVSGADGSLVSEACEACSEAVNKAAACISDLSLCQAFQISEPEHELVPRLLKHGYALLDIENLPRLRTPVLRAPDRCWVFVSELLCRRAEEAVDGDGCNGCPDEGNDGEWACIEACCHLLTRSYGTSDSGGHVLVLHLPDQKHWAIKKNVSGQADRASQFSRGFWESQSGKCLPSRVTGREGLEDNTPKKAAKSTTQDRSLESLAVWDLDAVSVRKCRLHAANSRQLRSEVRHFLHIFDEEVIGQDKRPKVRLTRSAADSKAVKIKRDIVSCASSAVLNQGLEALLPSLRSLEHMCNVAARHLAASAFKTLNFDVNETLTKLADCSAASEHVGACAHEGDGFGAVRLYRPFLSHQLASFGVRGGQLLMPFSSQQHVNDVLCESVRASVPVLQDRVGSSEGFRPALALCMRLAFDFCL